MLGDKTELPTVGERCETCRYWLDNGTPHEDEGYEPHDRHGYCRRYPPYLVGDEGECGNPAVMSFDWCGEWRAVQHNPAPADPSE